MVDKNLFLYDLAITAIFKDEAPYLKEWLDYHLLAGVDHFYLYNNDSSDNYKEVLAPYVEKNLVTLIDFPGEIMQMPAYADAINNYRFECRYMAFIDIDEFVYPKKLTEGIIQVVDEILSNNPNAAGLGINWQIYGSNGQETADYSRGVLERFTRRAHKDWSDQCPYGYLTGNVHVKTIANPRTIDFIGNPHYTNYFGEFHSINESGVAVEYYNNIPVTTNKIVVNHYYTKSFEEFCIKQKRGRSDIGGHYNDAWYDFYNRNEEFDDGILKYRNARKKKFYIKSDFNRIRRVEKALIEHLTQYVPSAAPEDFFDDKLETFLTCRAVAEKLEIKIGNLSAEEYSLAWIYTTFIRSSSMSRAEIEMFMRALPEILERPFPIICNKINNLTQNEIIPYFCEALKIKSDWHSRSEWLYTQKLLRLIK